MDANKLATLVNGHVAANLPHRATVQCAITPVNRRLSTLMLPSFYEQQPTTLDAEMIAELDAERELNGNLSGDPIARGLTSDEEDAEVGRLWGIDASRIEGGE